MRISVIIGLFLICTNVFAGFLVLSGTAAVIGVAPDPGADDKIMGVQQDADRVRVSVDGQQQTLIGSFVSMLKSLISIFSLMVTAGPTMLSNLGAPSWLTSGLYAILLPIVALDIYAAYKSGDTI